MAAPALAALASLAAPVAGQEPAPGAGSAAEVGRRATSGVEVAGYIFVAPGLAVEGNNANVLAHFGAGLELGRRLRGTAELGYVTSALALLSPDFDSGLLAYSIGGLYRFGTGRSLQPLVRGGYIGIAGEGEYLDGPYLGAGVDLRLGRTVGLLVELRDFLLPRRDAADANVLELRLGLRIG